MSWRATAAAICVWLVCSMILWIHPAAALQTTHLLKTVRVDVPSALKPESKRMEMRQLGAERGDHKPASRAGYLATNGLTWKERARGNLLTRPFSIGASCGGATIGSFVTALSAISATYAKRQLAVVQQKEPENEAEGIYQAQQIEQLNAEYLRASVTGGGFGAAAGVGTAACAWFLLRR